MADWNRTDYDQLEREGRWQMAIISKDPIHGVPPALVVYMFTALALLAFWR